MRFTTNIEWTKIRKLIIIILLSLLMAYITIKLIMDKETDQPQKIKIETEKSYCQEKR